MKLFNTLLNDEAGFVVSSELILIVTVTVIGLLVGLVTVRDQVVQELGDTALAIANMDQSYEFTGVDNAAGTASTAGSAFEDFTDLCGNDDALDTPPAGIDIAVPVTGEVAI